jgi:choice-of-anchor B domain-containing protein
VGLSWGNGIVEVTDPTNPVILTTIPGGVNSLWRDITVVGNYAYAVSDSVGVGIQVIDLSQIDAGVVTLVRNYSQGGHATSHTMLSNPASGYLYSCGGNIAGGGIMPCATTPDPTFPTFAGTGWTGHYVHEALIETYTSGPYAGREIAFLFTGGHGIVILDFTVKTSPTILSSITYPGRDYSHQGWLSPDKRFLYHNDESSGQVTRVFDVSDLSAPRLVSAFTKALGSIDHNEYTKGRYLYQSNYTTGLRVWDLANPLVPVEVAYIDTRPENNGSGYSGAWGNYPFFNSGTMLISDMNRGLFVVRLSLLELSPAGVQPTALAPSQPTPVSINVVEREAVTASVRLMVSVNEGHTHPTP